MLGSLPAAGEEVVTSSYNLVESCLWVWLAPLAGECGEMIGDVHGVKLLVLGFVAVPEHGMRCQRALVFSERGNRPPQPIGSGHRRNVTTDGRRSGQAGARVVAHGSPREKPPLHYAADGGAKPRRLEVWVARERALDALRTMREHRALARGFPLREPELPQHVVERDQCYCHG
jgi:hypothetical protein